MLFLLLSCNSKKLVVANSERNLNVKNDTTQITKNAAKVINDTVRIANEELEYEVIIIDMGFSTWLAANALPRGYLSQSIMEIKNNFYITEWNNRVLQPMRFNPNLYEMQINYDRNVNYGYEVNYLIYNYFIFFQNTYKQTLYGNVPLR